MMALLSPRVFTATMRRLAGMTLALRALMGDADTPISGTCAKGAANALDALLIATDDAALCQAAYHFRDAMPYGGYYTQRITQFLRAIDLHVRDLTRYCAEQRVRIHESLRWYPTIAPQAVFPSAAVDIGSLTMTGVGQGSLTQTATLDAAQYGDSLLEFVVADAPIGKRHLIGRLVGVDGFGQEVKSNVVLVPAFAQVGAAFRVPGTIGQPDAAHIRTIDSDKTLATLQGGTPGDRLRIRTRPDWEPSIL